MLAQAILKLETERRDYNDTSLEYCIAESLIQLCRVDPTAAKVIAGTEKTVEDCSKHIYIHVCALALKESNVDIGDNSDEHNNQEFDKDINDDTDENSSSDVDEDENQEFDEDSDEYEFGRRYMDFKCMTPTEIEKLIRDFYGLYSTGADEPQQQSEPDTGVVIDIMGLLAD